MNDHASQNNAKESEPLDGRPHMPESYGLNAAGADLALLSWSWVTEQMEIARSYWVGTSRPDGRPHVMPVWGVWIDNVFYFGTGPDTVKALNIESNPAAVVHLESGDDVVIVEGRAKKMVEMDTDLYERVAASYAPKYDGFAPNPPSVNEPLFAVHPQVVFAWLENDFPRTATRWRFSDS